MTFKLLLLPGDGIGPEVVAQAEKTILQLNKQFSLDIELESALVGGLAIDEMGTPLPEITLSLAKNAHAILLGAVGGPQWDDRKPNERPEKGLLQLRKTFNLFANLRPAILYAELVNASTLKPDYVRDLDLLIIRELTGGLYFGEPRGFEITNSIKSARNTMIYNETEIERVAKVAFDVALKRGKKVCSVDKANVLEVSQLWREIVNKMHKQYPTIELTHMYVDNAAMQLIQRPKQFDVILTENVFGDILSDCAAMLTGSIGMLPSASMNDKGFGLYEPVHGSAPDIAGKDIANPIATLLSVAMMLKYSLHQPEIANMLEDAIKQVLAQGFRTKDIAKDAPSVGTEEMGHAIRKALLKFN